MDSLSPNASTPDRAVDGTGPNGGGSAQGELPFGEPPAMAGQHNDRANAQSVPLWLQIKTTTETMLTALILAFVFRAFMVEAFIIPTGSMAPSLLGAHGTCVCSNCGWEYDFGPRRDYGRRDESNPDAAFEWPPFVVCPNCQERVDQPAAVAPPPKPGDRILVHKWPFDIGGVFGPRRWDVIVFRDPANPELNYIKRLVGLPHEKVEIIDGDVFIQEPGQAQPHIARKTAAAQSVLWSIVYDHDYIPLKEGEYGAFPQWSATEGSAWSGLGLRTLRCRPAGSDPQPLYFAPRGPHAFLQDVYGYNHGTSGALVGDVRLAVEITPRAGDGWIELRLERGPRTFIARVTREGVARLLMAGGGEGAAGAGRPPVEIGVTAVSPLRDDHPVALRLTHLDYRVLFEVDGNVVLETSDEQYAPDVQDLRQSPGLTSAVELSITSAGLALDARALRIDRDVHYTYRPGLTRRAAPGDPFELAEDEYFVLGDNSPESHDSRLWFQAAGYLGRDYRMGTVRRDQIVGRGFFVYLPGLMPLDGQGRWRMLDVGRARFVR